MRKLGWVIGCVALYMALAPLLRAEEPTLAKADWSVNSPHNLALNPPSADEVSDFVNKSASGDTEGMGHACSFRFVDLQRKGNLSLIASMDWGGHGGCGETVIYDKIPSGFDAFTSWALFGDNSVQDINHDGKFELVLEMRLGPDPQTPCAWPLVFAWTADGYKEVSTQYKNYYERYLRDLDKQLAAEPAEWAKWDLAPAGQPQPSTPMSPDPDNQTNYYCVRLGKAKTEAFLGIHSEETMRYAIKNYESKTSDDRELAADLFSFIGTPKATNYLKRLAADKDSDVSDAAKERLSGESNSYYYAITYQPENFLEQVATPTPSP